MGDIGDAFAFAIYQIMIITALVTALVVGSIVFLLMWWSRPTKDDLLRDQKRQEVIQTLTEEQREALGL